VGHCGKSVESPQGKKYAQAEVDVASWCSVIIHWLRSKNQPSCSMSGPVTTWMGNRLWVGKPPRLATSHPGQLSLPFLWASLIEYRPVRLGLGWSCSLVLGDR